MSNRELARQLIENLSKYRLGYVVAHLQGINANEAADDMFCAQLLEDYKNSEDKGEFVSLEEAAKMCGVKIKIDSVLSVLNNMMQKYIFTVIKQFLNFQFSVFI